MAEEAKHIGEVLRDMPKNWGRWGKNDELGSINFLTREEVVRGARAVRSGKVFALGVPVGRKEGDPIYPGLKDLADDCAKDGQYDFLFVGAPLKIVGGTGSPVNPFAIK